MKNTIVKDAVILFVITLIAGIALGAVHAITLEPIRQAQIAAANATYAQVYPEAAEFVESDELNAKKEQANADMAGWDFGNGKIQIDEILVAKSASGEEIGYMVNASSMEGYGGQVEISAGITNDGKLTGLGFIKINETPGLGMRAKDAEFRDQFSGKDATGKIEMLKGVDSASDSQFIAISGASFTSGAVNNALNTAVKFVNEYVK